MQVPSDSYLTFILRCSSTAHKTLRFYKISFGDVCWFAGRSSLELPNAQANPSAVFSTSRNKTFRIIFWREWVHTVHLALSYFLFLICWGFVCFWECEILSMDWMTKEVCSSLCQKSVEYLWTSLSISLHKLCTNKPDFRTLSYGHISLWELGFLKYWLRN